MLRYLRITEAHYVKNPGFETIIGVFDNTKQGRLKKEIQGKKEMLNTSYKIIMTSYVSPKSTVVIVDNIQFFNFTPKNGKPPINGV